MITNITLQDFKTHIYFKGFGSKGCEYGQYYNKPCDIQEKKTQFIKFYSKFEED